MHSEMRMSTTHGALPLFLPPRASDRYPTVRCPGASTLPVFLPESIGKKDLSVRLRPSGRKEAAA
jgi:hypothetical protein